MDVRLKIGLRIKELRKDLGITQEVLSFKAELDKTYVNEVENGKRNVSVVNLEKIILALDTDMYHFFQSEPFIAVKIINN